MDKKISFGFAKSSKKVNLFSKPQEKPDVQLIDCVEDQSIKIVGQKEEVYEPLVIPMKNPTKRLMDIYESMKSASENGYDMDDDKNKNGLPESENSETGVENGLTLDELAARELLNDVNNKEKLETTTPKIRTLPIPADQLKLEGEAESTLEDYESVPITEFGLAMLRGMGWKDGTGIGKNQKPVKVSLPELRPKGMGLGADKFAKQDGPPAVDKEGRELKLVKGAYVKIIAGHHKGYYGQIIGFDEEAGRLIVRTALNNLTLSLNEFIVQPVTKEEYNKNSKVLNFAKYEDYSKPKTESHSSEEQSKKHKSKIKEEVASEESGEDSNEELEEEYPRKSSSSSGHKTGKSRHKHDEYSDRKHKHKSDSKTKHGYESDDENYERKMSSSSSSRHKEDTYRGSKYKEDNYRDTKKKDKYGSSYKDDRREKSKDRYKDDSSRDRKSRR